MDQSINQLTSGTLGSADFVPINRAGSNFKLNLNDAIQTKTFSLSTTGGNGILDDGLLVKYNNYGGVRGEYIYADQAAEIGEVNLTTGFLKLFSESHTYEAKIYSNPSAENDVNVMMPLTGGTLATEEKLQSDYLPIIGSTLTGTLIAPRVTKTSAAQAWNASTVLNFNSANEWIILGTLTGDTTITTSNRGLDKELSVIFLADASTRALTFSESWVWIGGNPPANLAAGKRAVLSLRCVGSAATDVLASWAVQP